MPKTKLFPYQTTEKSLSLMLTEAVPIYRLSCNMESEAAKVAYEGMQEYKFSK